MNVRDLVQLGPGKGVVNYRRMQAIDASQLTPWRVTFYSEFLFAGDPAAPDKTTQEVAVITGPRRLVVVSESVT